MLTQKVYSMNTFLVKYNKLFKNRKFSRSVSLNLLSVFVGCSGRFAAKFISSQFMVDLGIYLFWFGLFGFRKDDK